jgi:hypothetical protein
MSSQEAEYGSSYNKKDRDCNKRYPRGEFDCDSNITPWGAYIIWFIILIVLIWILRAFNVRWFSAVVFSLVISAIVLSFIYPFKIKHGKYQFCNADSLYGIIVAFTVIILIIWFIWKVFTDRERHQYDKHGHLMLNSTDNAKDASWDWKVTADSPKGHTVSSGSGSVHRTPSVASMAPSLVPPPNRVAVTPATPVSQMGGIRPPTGPF